VTSAGWSAVARGLAAVLTGPHHHGMDLSILFVEMPSSRLRVSQWLKPSLVADEDRLPTRWKPLHPPQTFPAVSPPMSHLSKWLMELPTARHSQSLAGPLLRMGKAYLWWGVWPRRECQQNAQRQVVMPYPTLAPELQVGLPADPARCKVLQWCVLQAWSSMLMTDWRWC